MTSDATQYTWAGRFSEPVSDLVKRYTASVDFDQRMWRQDIRGSLAHARMLAKQGIIAAADLADIERGMAQVTAEIEAGKFAWSLDLEDVHLNIEKRLTALVGDAGKRLHTGRSRNDQVATDIRLYLRDAIDDILVLIKAFRSARWSIWPRRKRRRRCPASPICRSPSRSLSATTCWPISKCSAATPSASPMPASAPTACRSAPPRWPARPTRSTANSSPPNSASKASARTRSTPFPTATSPSNSPPPARC